MWFNNEFDSNEYTTVSSFSKKSKGNDSINDLKPKEGKEEPKDIKEGVLPKEKIKEIIIYIYCRKLSKITQILNFKV